MDSGQESTLNALFKSLSPLVKQLDERRARASCLASLFEDEVTAWRQELVQGCEDAFFDDQDCVSPKPREVMWRKGYYDTISMAKRFVHKHHKSQMALGGGTHHKQSTTTATDTIAGMDQLCAFIEEGIQRLKSIIVRIERDYNLDLQYIVDLTLFASNAGQVDDDVVAVTQHEAIPINKKITSLEIINFALESIHSLIVSLGDLHRYYLDFGLDKQFGSTTITKALTAQYYAEAFKLNPKNGMPQNQLGTLWIGRNHNLDSVYHYLYSLVCAKPFELSEDNVVRIFQQGAAYLEALVMPTEYQVTLRDFVARFLLVVDIFFFDKHVPTFNDLCRFLLCDLNAMLRKTKSNDGLMTPVLDQDMLFKLTAVLFFCMRKLKRVNSPKVYQLNAFLAAICDQFVESCNANFKEFFDAHAMENEEYQERYQQVYALFNNNNNNNNNINNNNEDIQSGRDQQLKIKGGHRNGLSNGASTAEDDGASSTGGKTPLTAGSGSNSGSVGRGKGGGRVAAAVVGRSVAASEAKKRVMKYRRRRRRSTYSSDSDLTSNFDSDSDKSEVEEDDEDGDGDSDEDYSDDDEEEEEYGDYNSDVVVDPEATLVNGNGHGNGFDDGTLIHDDQDYDSDLVIEEERTVMVQRKPEVVNGGKEDQYTGNGSVAVDVLLDQLRINTDGQENGDMDKVKQRDRTRVKVGVVKDDPNLLLRFVDAEPTIRALKVLFDWLMDNKEIVWECYQSNPEFVDKIMTLLNAVNVNIFTRRVFFERQLLTVDGLREDIRCLFEARAKLPIAEDLALKHFAECVRAQAGLDWEMASQLQVTPMEENLLRVVKLKNFGFFICDRRKFGYAFRNCRFEEMDVEQMRRKRNAKRGDGRRQQQQHQQQNGWGSGSGSGENRRERRRRQRRMQRQEAECMGDGYGGGGGGGGNRRDRDGFDEGGGGGGRRRRRGQQQQQSQNGVARGDASGGGGGRQQSRRAAAGGRGAQREVGNGDQTRSKDQAVCREKEMLKKGELMGKLWLRNEVKNLESKARGPKGMGLLTPYVVVDTKALVQHLSIVKHFVSMKKFIVLIPSEVLAELDALKTQMDRARECIRWLDRTISNGSPFLKTQEIKEKLPIPDYVKPLRQGMRTEATSFVEIAEFCHYLAHKYAIEGQSVDDVLTLLTGEDLAEKEAALADGCDYVAILRAIPIKFDRIDKFYGKLIKK